MGSVEIREKPKGRGRVKRVNPKLTCPKATTRISLNVLLQLLARREQCPEERAEHFSAMLNWAQVREIEYYWHDPLLSFWDSRQSLYLIVADMTTVAKIRKQCLRKRYNLVVKHVHDLPPSVLARREEAFLAMDEREGGEQEC